MGKEINKDNIKNFVEGNTRLLTDRIGMLPKHIKEQVEFRASKCYESCYKGNNGHCIKCGCSVPGRWYTTKTCNENKFPDIMNKEDWDEYKRENNY